MTDSTCDTSVVVPALASWHEHHDLARRSMQGVVALPACVLVETVSVLSRLPHPMRISASMVAQALEQLDLPVLALPATDHLPTLRLLAASGVTSGALYDGLVAATSTHHGFGLLTLDRRAERVYVVSGTDYTLLSG